MKRRDFLKLNAKGALLAAAGGAGLILPDTALSDGTPDLAVAKGSPAAAARAAMELLGGMKNFVKPGQRVLIKPNMSFANPPDMATTTHPEVVSAVAAMCKEAGAGRVDILDNVLSSVETCLERTGIAAACKAIGPNMVEGVTRSDRFKETEIDSPLSMSKTDVMKEVLEADVLIAVPQAKHHSSAGVSLAMKGMMGLILNRGVFHWRYDLHEAIVDLNTVCKADLSIIDCTRVLTTNGPSGPGKVIKPGMVVAGKDFVATDAKVVSMFKWYDRKVEPKNVKHIRIAHERGLGRMDVDALITKTVEV
jgi:uncharacterized protein (DUF362 family)